MSFGRSFVAVGGAGIRADWKVIFVLRLMKRLWAGEKVKVLADQGRKVANIGNREEDIRLLFLSGVEVNKNM